MHISGAVETLESMVLVITAVFPVLLSLAARPQSSSIRGMSFPIVSTPPASASSWRPDDYHNVTTILTTQSIQL